MRTCRPRTAKRPSNLPVCLRRDRCFRSLNDLAQVIRLADDFEYHPVWLGQFAYLRGIRRGYDECAAGHDLHVAEVLEQPPMSVIGRCDIVQHDLGVVLTDQAFEVDLAISNL